MTSKKILSIIKADIFELMGRLSIKEVTENKSLIREIEDVLRALSSANI